MIVSVVKSGGKARHIVAEGALGFRGAYGALAGTTHPNGVRAVLLYQV
jgi:hypothetical protein